MGWTLNPVDWFRRAAEGSSLCAWVGVVFVAILAISLIGLAVDQRQVLGINPWIKPIKFLLSAIIFVWTMGWLLSLVDVPAGSREWAGGVVAAMLLGEIIAITGQAARGVRSHYNTASAFDGMVFSLMGLMIVINTLVIGVVLLWFFQHAKPMPESALWGCRLGLLLAFLGSVQGGFMAYYGSHAVGVPDGGPGLPFVNWATNAGDLRIAHFIGLHGMQVLPWAGFLFAEWGGVAALLLAALVHYGAFTLTFLQAMAKKPLFF
jgi:hypothetical protein